MNPTEPMGRQAIMVLAALRRGPSCLQEFGSVAYVARNRVGDLRKLGWTISAVPCRRHPHRGRVAEYRLKGGTAYLERTVTSDGVAAAGSPAVSVVAPLLFPEPQLRGGHGR